MSPNPIAAALALGMLVHIACFARTDDARAQKIVGGSCFLCHGVDGEAASEAFPRLAGQNAAYVTKQLENFKTGARISSAMAPMVEKLSTEDMVALGHYYAGKQPVGEPVQDAALAQVGKYIYQVGNKWSGVPACASCHGDDATGSDALPRLAGQHASYLDRQLRQFNERERNNDNSVMHIVVEKMTAFEMAAVAQYLSGL